VRACFHRRLQYEEEEHAEKALNALNGRFYAGRLLMAEYSPVTDFRTYFVLLIYSPTIQRFIESSKMELAPHFGGNSVQTLKTQFPLRENIHGHNMRK
jgi:hypothetical protein